MKYDKNRGGYVLSQEEVTNLNAKIEKARRLAENLAYYEQLMPWLPSAPWRKKVLN